ncbi:MAG: 50S ribosomal protein L1 [Erysipelotrichaceae bacterium]|jgi:large subunit ribosomal protein L1|nr:50S ribosomal protein L1 [Bacilli bacterium]NLV28838.1 50S ribosomal protein L1 [Erysipelotrichaceae bacterium]
MKRAKKYLVALEKVDHEKLYTLEEAAKLVKETSTVKFDATIDVSLKLNVDPKQADQQVRGTLILPNGNGKTKKVLAITDKVEEAKAAGADFVGGKELLDRIQSDNWFDFDVIVATPNMMGEIGKLGRVLGPKGLMPNPKTGTVSPDIGKAIKEIKAGKIEYRVDKEGNMHVTIARVSFDADKIVENLKVFVEAVMKAKPAAVKNAYVKNAVIHTTMGPAVHFTFEGRK